MSGQELGRKPGTQDKYEPVFASDDLWRGMRSGIVRTSRAPYLLSNWIPNLDILFVYHFVSVIEQLKLRRHSPCAKKLTCFIHERREHVETEQSICVQVVQQAPPDTHISHSRSNQSTALTMGCLHKRGYSETCQTIALFSAIDPGMRWPYSVAGRRISFLPR